MRDLRVAIAEAARATTLEELGVIAFPALARALDACPAYFAESAEVFVESRAIAGEHGDVLPGYLHGYGFEDPIMRFAASVRQPVTILEDHVDRRIIRSSRAYDEFHRVFDFEHHLLIRFFGPELMAPGSLSFGLTRGKNLPEFSSRELRLAQIALPTFQGAAARIVENRASANLESEASRAAGECGLSHAETRVLSALLLGLSNAEIGRRLFISVDTVKTHVQRIFRKVGVVSRAQAIARVRELCAR